ncbi:MAG TPA: creatininase family protein [Casimicrobiaceae bacterium]|nr:creatininase family protein [Casimicrobiaceae bacterium]
MPLRSLHFLAALLVLVAIATHAQPRSVRLEDFTSTELADAIARGSTTILVPIGGTEQNGAHIALGKHNRRVEVLAHKIAGVLGNVLVAPVIAYVPEGSIDPPSAHMRYPGTISVPSDVFMRTLEAAANSLRRHGFRDIVLLGDHGGYQSDLASTAARVNASWSRSPARVHALVDYYRTSDAAFRELLSKRGFRSDEIGRHAGLADTSLTLAVDASLVRLERLRDAKHPGVNGDPSRASSELGQAGVDLIVSRSADAIRALVARR